MSFKFHNLSIEMTLPSWKNNNVHVGTHTWMVFASAVGHANPFLSLPSEKWNLQVAWDMEISTTHLSQWLCHHSQSFTTATLPLPVFYCSSIFHNGYYITTLRSFTMVTLPLSHFHGGYTMAPSFTTVILPLCLSQRLWNHSPSFTMVTLSLSDLHSLTFNGGIYYSSIFHNGYTTTLLLLPGYITAPSFTTVTLPLSSFTTVYITTLRLHNSSLSFTATTLSFIEATPHNNLLWCWKVLPLSLFYTL